MKKFLIALCLMTSMPLMADEVVGSLGGTALKRSFDPQTNVVCYSLRYDNLSCVYVPPTPKEPKTNKSEDVPE